MSTHESKTADLGWVATHEPGFGSITPADDFLHPDVHVPDFSQAETYWFNFYVPERGLSGAVYCWMHANLGSATAGVWIYQGFKSHHLLCEHFNVQSHLPYPQLRDNTLGVPHVGIEIEIVEPLKAHAIRYRDAASGTALDLRATALMPPAVRSNNLHFEQAMRVQGTLTLAGEEIMIDSMSVRDHSWGQGRSEDPANHPPMDWSVGVVEDGKTAFNILGCDDPDQHPGWAERYGITADDTLRDGWFYHDGKIEHVTRATQFVKRTNDGMFLPKSVHIDFETESGMQHTVTGRVVSQCPFGLWPNLYSNFNMVEWDLDGRRAWGDLQDMYWKEFLQA